MQYPPRRHFITPVFVAFSLCLIGCGGGDGAGSSPGELAGCVMGGGAPIETLGCPDPFVDAHNTWRSDLSAGNLGGQPPASPALPDVSWDPVLAQVAADWAARCDWEHNSGRTDDYHALGGSAGYVGENISAQWGIAPTALDVLDGWGAEYVDYDYATNSCAPNEACGHYTQVVWAASVEIGCGTALCPEVNFDGDVATDVWFTVCNYAPGGNYNGEWPYSD